jgi:ABC-2 type transport system ATP-binding protein
MLTTLLPPTSGTARINGFDVVAAPNGVRKSIGVIPQAMTSDLDLSADENMRIYAKLYGIPREKSRATIAQLLEAVDLTQWADKPLKMFSGGMRRRLEIARGLLHSPKVLFLDEPTIGLDPQTRASIWTYIGELHKREEITVFVTTHYMDEAENCDRIAIVDQGKIVALDTPANLKAAIGKDRVQIATADDPAAITALKDKFELEARMVEGLVTFAVAEGAAFVPQLFEKLGVPIKSVTVQQPSLDDVFLNFTGTSLRDAESRGAGAGLNARRAAMMRGR